VSLVGGLLKFYAYVYHLALSTFLIVIAILAKVSHQPLHLEMVPFNQERMISRVSLLSLLGFACVFLALVRIFEFVFPLWSIAVVVLMVWGFFFTPYAFRGIGGLEWALLLIVGAVAAFFGSILVLLPQRRNRW
jgi:Na+/glutamate symporter